MWIDIRPACHLPDQPGEPAHAAGVRGLLYLQDLPIRVHELLQLAHLHRLLQGILKFHSWVWWTPLQFPWWTRLLHFSLSCTARRAADTDAMFRTPVILGLFLFIFSAYVENLLMLPLYNMRLSKIQDPSLDVRFKKYINVKGLAK